MASALASAEERAHVQRALEVECCHLKLLLPVLQLPKAIPVCHAHSSSEGINSFWEIIGSSGQRQGDQNVHVDWKRKKQTTFNQTPALVRQQSPCTIEFKKRMHRSEQAHAQKTYATEHCMQDHKQQPTPPDTRDSAAGPQTSRHLDNGRKVSKGAPGVVVAAVETDGGLEASLGAVKVLGRAVFMAAQRVAVREARVQLQRTLEEAHRALVLLRAGKHNDIINPKHGSGKLMVSMRGGAGSGRTGKPYEALTPKSTSRHHHNSCARLRRHSRSGAGDPSEAAQSGPAHALCSKQLGCARTARRALHEGL